EVKKRRPSIGRLFLFLLRVLCALCALCVKSPCPSPPLPQGEGLGVRARGGRGGGTQRPFPPASRPPVVSPLALRPRRLRRAERSTRGAHPAAAPGAF